MDYREAQKGRCIEIFNTYKQKSQETSQEKSHETSHETSHDLISDNDIDSVYALASEEIKKEETSSPATNSLYPKETNSSVPLKN